MHEVDRAFHDLAIKERDYARVQVDNRGREIARLREQVESVRADERQRCVIQLRTEAAAEAAETGAVHLRRAGMLATAADVLEAGSVPAETGEQQ
jgi:hypothetical protein